MNQQEILNLIKGCLLMVAPEIEFEKINTGRNFRAQIELDSYDMYKFIAKLEDSTKVVLPETTLRNIETLNDLIQYLSGRLETK